MRGVDVRLRRQRDGAWRAVLDPVGGFRTAPLVYYVRRDLAHSPPDYVIDLDGVGHVDRAATPWAARQRIAEDAAERGVRLWRLPDAMQLRRRR